MKKGDFARFRPGYFDNHEGQEIYEILSLSQRGDVKLKGIPYLDIRECDLLLVQPDLKYWPKSKGQSGTEEQFQNECAKVLELKREDFYHCPNGGNRDAITGAKLKKAGTKKGVPNLIIVGKMMVIELKVGNNKPTAEQVWWLEKYRAIGWRAFWVNSLDEFLNLIGT